MSKHITMYVKSNIHFDIFTRFIENTLIDWSDIINNINENERVENVKTHVVFGIFGLIHFDVELSNEIVGISVLTNRDNIEKANLKKGEGFALMIPDCQTGRDLMQAIQIHCIESNNYTNHIILDLNDEEVVFEL